MHIVSNVRGRLRPDKDAIDLLRATFPAGTVSGAPKVRAMEVIEEVEPERRGLYAGCVGYFDYYGNMDTCIALRTLLVKDGKLYVQAGSGVVATRIPKGSRRRCLGQSAMRAIAREVSVKLLVIDNYDSFTYNLVQYLGELGASSDVVRNDAIAVEEVGRAASTRS
jgi:anthranilate synthase component 1